MVSDQNGRSESSRPSERQHRRRRLQSHWIGGIEVEVEQLGNERHATAVKHLDIREILATKTVREITLK